MSKKIQIKLSLHQNLEAHLRQRYPYLQDFRILSQALDARGANRGATPHYNYTVEILESSRPSLKSSSQLSSSQSEPSSKHQSNNQSNNQSNHQSSNHNTFDQWKEDFTTIGPLSHRPIIIGAGPAGLFCAIRLAEYGIPSLIIERGSESSKRMLEIAKFWRYGKLDEESNVCYGEGGAGLFSDGKLMTRVKSPYVSYVMKRFVDFGAPPETAYISNPHLGSNKIRKLIGEMANHLRSKNCEIRYNTRVDRLLFEGKEVVGVELNNGEKIYSPHVVLATGHSAKEMYHHLIDEGVAIKPKSFAVGVRIEHPRSYIDSLQYGPFASELGAARYRLSYQDQVSQKGTYSFCMCPGGYVLSSGTEADGLVVNGMSNYAHNSPWSNAALVVSVEAGKDFAQDFTSASASPSSLSSSHAHQHLLQGLYFQQQIEQKAFKLSSQLATGREIPALSVGEFLKGKLDGKKPLPKTSCPSGVVKAPLEEVLPEFIINHLKNALDQFDKNMKGFRYEKAMLLVPETRTSAPVTILRDPTTLESVSHRGVYPCGEGAGYAGGITSAAVDGVNVAISIFNKNKK